MLFSDDRHELIAAVEIAVGAIEDLIELKLPHVQSLIDFDHP
jgi:hypothetical protein